MLKAGPDTLTWTYSRDDGSSLYSRAERSRDSAVAWMSPWRRRISAASVVRPSTTSFMDWHRSKELESFHSGLRCCCGLPCHDTGKLGELARTERKICHA